MVRAPTSDPNEKVNSAVVLPFSRSQDQIPHDAQHPSASTTPHPGLSPPPPPTPALLTLAPCWSPRLELFSQARPLVPRVGSVFSFSMSPRGLLCSPSRCRGAPHPAAAPSWAIPFPVALASFSTTPCVPCHPPPHLLQNQPLGDRGLCLFGRLTPGGPEQIFVRCPHGLQRQPRTRTGAQSLEGPKEPLPVSQP